MIRFENRIPAALDFIYAMRYKQVMLGFSFKFSVILSCLTASSFAFALPKQDEAFLLARIPDNTPAAPILAEKTEILQELTEIPANKLLSFSAAIKDAKYPDSKACSRFKISAQYLIHPQDEVQTFSFVLARPKHSGSAFGALIVQPTLAGPGQLEIAVADRLCEAGFLSLTPTETKLGLLKPLPDFESYDKNTQIEMIRAQRMVDFVEAQSLVSTGHIGTIGFSRGAIAGALLAGIESRIRYAYLGAGGVGLPHIIAYSETQLGSEETHKQMAAGHFTQQEYEILLRQKTRYDGILFTDRIPAGSVRLMLCRDDTSVAIDNQRLLVRMLKDPEVEIRQAASYVGDPRLNNVSPGFNTKHVACIIDDVFKNPKSFTAFFLKKMR